MTNTFKAAVVQAAPVVFDRERTLSKVHALTAEAARAGARLVVFPEAFVSGYPRGMDFGAVVGARTDEGREQFRRYWESSVDVPGPAVEELSRTARAADVYLVVGVIERAGGTLYCSVLFFAPDGSLLGKHRKLMPTASERLVWGFGDGSTMPVFDTSLGKLGAVICWENYLPLMRAAMYAKAIEIYCAPTADSRDSWIASMRHIAVEGRCYVLSCNQYNRRKDFPPDYCSSLPADADAIICRGGSCIVDPFGNFLAGPNTEGEAILTAEIDRAQIIRGKFDLDVVGHYARPDIFELHVDERQKAPVTVHSDRGPKQAAGIAQAHRSALREEAEIVSMTDLRYPIGPFQARPAPDPHTREQFLSQMAELPTNLRAAVANLSDEQLDTPYRPGGWTVRQVVHHLADAGMNWYVRTKLALTEDKPAVKTYEEARWAELHDARTEPIETSLMLLEGLHRRWVDMFRSFSQQQWKRSMVHPERGPLELDAVLAMLAWHGRHHTAHIAELRKRLSW